MSIVAATLLILAAGGAEGANTPPTNSQPTNTQPANTKPQNAAAEDDPMICHTDNVLGSRIKRKRICMKRSEWQRQHQEEKMMIDRTQVQRGCRPAG